MRGTLVLSPERCTGCRQCQLICSWVHHRVFNPERSWILVDVDEKRADFHLNLTEQCTCCGVCARYCLSGALVIEKGGQSDQ